MSSRSLGMMGLAENWNGSAMAGPFLFYLITPASQPFSTFSAPCDDA